MSTKKAATKTTTKTTKTAAKAATKPTAAKKPAAKATTKAETKPAAAVPTAKAESTKVEGPRGKNPGITKILRDMATKKPVTHDEVMAALVKAFPDRRAEGMRITVHALLPSALLRRGVKVVTTKGDDGVKRFQITESNG